jgi:UDP:flavonoid glycosyltransferase YjiC (YdhE family)
MSLGSEEARASADLFVNTIRKAGVRAIVQGWEAALKQLALPETIYPAGSIPHTWLLPRCAGVLHHGGLGTTSAGLLAGLPALVIPHLVDQYYWGQRIHELGVGPRPIPRPKLTVQGLGVAMSELAQDVSFRAAASRLGEQIRLENGVDNAVRLIEETFGT